MVLSKGVIKKVSAVKKATRIQSLEAACLSLKKKPVWYTRFPALSFPMVIVSMHATECRISEPIWPR